MKATHHSVSYGEPINWYGKLINFTAKCQNKSIIEQYSCGVRVFDIRIRRHKGCWHIAHGKVVYKLTAREVFDTLKDLVVGIEYTNDPIFIRLTLEQDNASRYDKELFTDYCSVITSIFPSLCFVGFYDKTTKEQLYNYNHLAKAQYPKLYEMYASVAKNKALCWFPYLWAMLFNKKVSVPEGKVWMQDFV